MPWTIGYNISAVIGGNANVKTINSILSAVDFWSKALSGSVFSSMASPASIWNGFSYISNPLAMINTSSLMICITTYFQDNLTLGAAGIEYVRTSTPSSEFYIPYQSFFYLNTKYADDVDVTTYKGFNNLYYTVVHELGHALGIGTLWYDKYNSGGTDYLTRCFVVGAGDNSTNPLGLTTSANFFYSANAPLVNPRPQTSIGKITTIGAQGYYIGDADEWRPWNDYNTIASFSAVNQYNNYWGTSLTAIPIENGGGFGSIASHWDEGHQTGGAVWGGDTRRYYGGDAPGAPCLNDELMTPIAENAFDTPITKVTLGALTDLGYTVDYNQATNYEPKKFVIYATGSGLPLYIDPYNSGARTYGSNATNPNLYYISLKRGFTYTFDIQTGSHPIYVVTTEGQTGAPPASRVTTGITNDGITSGNLTWNTTSITAGTYYLQCGNHAAMSCRIIVN